MRIDKLKKLMVAMFFVLTSVSAAWIPPRAAALPPHPPEATFSRTELPQTIDAESPAASAPQMSDLANPPVISAANSTTLSLDMNEDVFLPADGTDASLAVVITAPSGTMAQIYRLMFGIAQQTAVGVPIPLQNSPSAGESKSEFYESMEKQQLVSLGLVVNFSESTLIPRTAFDEFKVVLKGTASFPGLNFTQDGSGTAWRIPIGLRGNNSTDRVTQYAFENIVFAKWMLESFSGTQRYELRSRAAFHLPPNANLENRFNIGALSWTIDLGGGTSLSARLSIGQASTIFLEELTSVTEEEITTAPDEVLNSFSTYKIFDIDYFLSQPSVSATTSQPVSVDNDFSKDFSFSTSPNIPPIRFEKTIGDNTANATVKVDITTAVRLGISAHVDADIGVVRCGYFCIKITTRSFHTWFQLEASATATLHVVATGQVDCCDAEELFDPPIKLTTFSFSIGPVPVWMDLNLGARAELEVKAHGIVILDASVQMTEKFRAGLQWTREHGWERIGENHFSINTKGPIVSGNAGIHIDAGLPLRLELLVYSAAGPEVSFRPYVTADASVSGSATPTGASLEGNWTVKVGFKVLVGISFAPKLAKVLGLKDSIKDWEVFDKVLREWSGTFKLGTPPFSAKTSSSTKSALTSNFISAGSSIPIRGSVIGPTGTGFAGADVDITVYGEFLSCFARSQDPEGNPAYCVFRDFASGTECRVPLETTGPCAGPFNASHWICFNSYPNAGTGEPACGPMQVPLSQWHTTTDPSGNYVQDITAPEDTGRYFVDILVSYAGLADFGDEDFIAFTVKPVDYSAPLVDAMVILLSLSENATDTSSVVFSQNSTLIPSNVWYSGNVSIIWEVSDNESGVSSTSGCQTVTLTDDTPGTTLNCTATNAAGLTNSTSVTIRIDNSPPVVMAVITPLGNVKMTQGWFNSDVTISWSVSDPLSGIESAEACEIRLSGGIPGGGFGFASPCGNQDPNETSKSQECKTIILTHDTLGMTFACFATNGSGLGGLAFAHVAIDKTPPVITGARMPEANSKGWNDQPVTVNFACSDAFSGVGSAPGAVILNSDGAAQSVTGTCSDIAGNSASSTVDGINIDMTKPVITSSRSSDPNANRWNNVPVIVSFSCTDLLSGVDSLSAPVTLSDGRDQSALGTCADRAGNSADLTESGINVDLTPPVISGSRTPTPNSNGWNSADVSVAFSCVDTLSGVDSVTGNTVVRTEGAGQSVTGACADNAGNLASTLVGPINIDKTNPFIVIGRPSSTQYTHNSSLTLDYTVGDGEGSGLQQVTVLIDGLPTLAGHGLQSGQRISMLTELSLGQHTFLITTVDRAENKATSSTTFTIVVTANSIKDDVRQFVATGKIKLDNGSPLLRILDAAAAKRAVGDCASANRLYQAFITTLQMQSGKLIDATAASIIIMDAQYLVAHCP